MKPILIKPQHQRTLAEDTIELWETRYLVWVLALRGISVRYKQSVIGLGWIVIQPVLQMMVYTFLFQYLARVSTGDVPYAVFTFSGLILWQYISKVIGDGSGCFVQNAPLITKVYFPRMTLPLSIIIQNAFDFFINLCVLILLLFLFGIVPSLKILFVLIIFVCAGLLSFGVALAFASLNAIWRDATQAIPFLLQIAMFLSPVVYPSSLIPEKWQWLLNFNPIATLMQAMRWAVTDSDQFPSFEQWGIFAGYCLIFFLLGRFLFAKLETEMIDKI